MAKSCFSLLLLVLFLPIKASALELYSGEVAVADRSDRERLAAVPAALLQVLQKHSGLRELPIHPALDEAMVNANRMLLSFHFVSRERGMPDGTVVPELRLVAEFSPAVVDQLVADMALPRWRHERHPLTIWIVVDDGLGRRLMPLEYQYAWDALIDVANLRGLPIRWPEIDPESDGLIDLQLLWGGFTDSLPGHDERLGGDVIVAARREGPLWNVRWNFGSDEETAGWRVRERDLTFALVDGLHQLTDIVAARDSIAAAGQGEWRIDMRISGVQGAEDYARCLAYLEGLGVVEEVTLIEASSGEVMFLLELNAMPQYLAAEMERDRVLTPGEGSHNYRLVPF
ncbi:MAG: DUF2066 domain-containing protein [Xanthomonadales bacterium]|nr:DUF2066 domain-containing protein [Gammaproteobacteria bacterium]NNL96084.1 DUF2066 domain-containing protein [Xanthomonadales bacterium]